MKIQIEKISLEYMSENYSDFIIGDLRSGQSYSAVHLENSFCFQDEDQIISFLKTKSNKKPLLLLCFSKQRSKKIAQDLCKNSDFKDIYGFEKLYYLDAGFMELNNTHLPLVEHSASDKNRDNALSLAQQTIIDIRNRIEKSSKTFVVAFSGGKDSSVVLHLMYEALCSLPKEKRRKTYAIVSNTLVEPPHIEKYLRDTIASINSYSKENNIPFEVLEVMPSEDDQFWVNLIGKGYPSPTRTFRWCTDRLKIAPAKKTIENIVKKEGSVILCLGVRKSESIARKNSIEKRLLNEEGYSLHEDFANTLIYSPIKEWTTDDVWAYLLSNPPRWKKKYDELFALYTKASGDECQFITDLKQSSCGGSRFGCWVCTVVSEDKSMQGFINSGDKKLKPLNDFRNFIKEIREDPSKRANYMRDGRAVYKIGGRGPFLSFVRIQILRKLLDSETEYIGQGGTYLISDSQIEEIQRQWSRDFDLSFTAIKIAKEYNRMMEKDIDMTCQILHEEILEEIARNKENVKLGLEQKDFQDLIASAVEIIGNRAKSKVDIGIKQEIEKLIADKTSREGEKENVY